MSLRLKPARIISLAYVCCCCWLTPNAVQADQPGGMEKPQMATPVMGQFDAPATSGQGASAQALQGKLESDSASDTLKGQTAGSGKSPPTVLKAKTSANAPLQGAIHASGSVLPAFKLHMTEDQLKSAVAQYTADLQQFYLHAKDYHLTQEALKKQIGECTENQQQWEATLAKDKLNLNTVIIATGVPNMPPPPAQAPPTIAPPRVCCVGCLITGRCGHLGTGGGASAGPQTPSGFSRSEAMRIQDASAGLQKAQNRLGFSEKENSFTSQNAINEARIEQSQQGLAEKFGRLQQEFDTLKIEKEALTGAKIK
jgi:hypothetical protein